LPSANLATVSTNLAGIVDHVAPMRSRGPDLICLPEMCASWGVAGDPTQVAIERAPFLDAIGDAARAARSYVVAAFYEREGDAVYNTALLVDRGGQFVGEYRKTHLTALEKLAGVSAGSALEVFETDIGVIGMVICWDLWHPEPARLAALQGAQIIAWPYEADRHPAHRQHTPASRAMENGVTIVGASQASPAPIVDADGTILALLEDGLAHAYAEVQLGGPSDRRRWPHAALRGDNRRNLIEHERNTAIAAKIATVRDRKE
jgi:predicted amidohydrolase